MAAGLLGESKPTDHRERNILTDDQIQPKGGLRVSRRRGIIAIGSGMVFLTKSGNIGRWVKVRYDVNHIINRNSKLSLFGVSIAIGTFYNTFHLGAINFL